MQVWFMDAHVLETRCCSYLCIPECFHLHLLHHIHCIASVQGEFQLQGELWVLLDLMCACANKGENFERSDRTRGRLVWFFEKLVVHRALRAHHFGRVAFFRGKNFSWGVSALIWLLVSSFSLLFQHDCVERYLCLWGVMFWLLIDCVEPLPLS